MTEALGSGWLIPLSVAVLTIVIVPVGKWVAIRWNKPLQEEIQARIELQQRMDELHEKLADEKLRRIYLEAKSEALEKELDNWRSGRWAVKQ